MPFLLVFATLLGFVVSVSFANSPATSLHPGSTRDWVKRNGVSGDSVRYHLEFLGSTRDIGRKANTLGYFITAGDSQQTVSAQVTYTDTVVDWQVRITSADSPSVVDTAVLRVHSGAVTGDRSDIPADRFRLENLTYWIKPSTHFPIDLGANSTDDALKVAYYRNYRDSVQILTGAWEVSLLEKRPKVKITSSPPNLCYFQLWEGFCHSSPTIESRGDTGIVAWLANGAFWELAAIDMAPRAVAVGTRRPPLRKGETWVYRDSTWSMPSQYPFPVRHFSLELLEIGEDSSGWIRLHVGMRSHPDTGRDSNSTLSILLDPQRFRVRMDSTVASVWGLVPGNRLLIEVRWALGLLPSPIGPDDSTTKYRFSSSFSAGEVTYSTTSAWLELSRSIDAGTTYIQEARATTMTSYGVTMGSRSGRSWTLVAHALDNSVLSASPRSRGAVRDVSWLRSRLAADPTLEVVRIGLDGSRSRARGTTGISILERRGIAMLQVRDGQSLVTLRLVRP